VKFFSRSTFSLSLPPVLPFFRLPAPRAPFFTRISLISSCFPPSFLNCGSGNLPLSRDFPGFIPPSVSIWGCRRLGNNSRHFRDLSSQDFWQDPFPNLIRESNAFVHSLQEPRGVSSHDVCDATLFGTLQCLLNDGQIAFLIQVASTSFSFWFPFPSMLL